MSYKKSFIIIFFFSLLFFISVPLSTWAESIPDKSHSSLSVSSSVPADGQTTAIITVTLQDASGNPIAGHTVTLEDSSNSGATITTMSGTTDTSGHAIFSIKSTKAQKDNINVTDTTSNVTFYNLGEITFTSEGCFDSPPGSTPYLTSATAISATQIKLTWTGVANPVTRYLLSYGAASGQYIYGNPNIGGQGTTSYTVSSLTPGKKYYFVIQVINGCAPGNFSNELSVTPADVVFNSPTQTPSLEPSPKISNQMNISPTYIPNGNVNVSTNSPNLIQKIQPTTSIKPPQNFLIDSARSTILLIVSLCIVIIGSLGNIIYWKHKQKLNKTYKHLSHFEEIKE